MGQDFDGAFVMHIPFNEISLHKDFISQLSEHKQAEIVSQFLDFIKLIKEKGVFDSFLTEFNFSEEISHLLVNSYIGGVQKSFLLSFFTKNVTKIFPENQLDEFKITINEKEYESSGCTYASRKEFDKIVISFPTHDFWKHDRLAGIYSFYDENERKQTLNVELIQISNSMQINCLVELDTTKKKQGISSGQDLWEHRQEFYPNLIFCENVKDQFYENPQKYHIERIMSCLDILHNYFTTKKGEYREQDLKDLGLNVSPESDSVKNNLHLKNLRTFKLPDSGISVYFSEHIKFNSIFSTRIYILPKTGTNKCYIGYVGKHLPTKKF